MGFDAATLPKVALSRAQWFRLIFVGIFVLVAIGRVLPDAVRAVYPLSLSGLALDPEERDQLVRVVAHASIALHQIELARYRTAAAQNAFPLGAR